MKNIAVFASGSGTNAENLIHYFSNNSNGTVKLILSNRIGAGVLDRADRLGVKSVVFDRDTFLNTEKILYLLQAEKIDYIVLAVGAYKPGILRLEEGEAVAEFLFSP